MIRRFQPPALAVALVALLAVVVHRWPPVTQARATASRSEVPAKAFGSKKIRAGLERAGALHLAPPADLLAAVPADSEGSCPETAIAVGSLAPEAFPSTRLLPAAWRARADVPVVSLYLEPCRLQRLLSNPRGRGKDWAARRFGHRDFDVLPGRARLDTRERELWDGLRRQLLTVPHEDFAAVASELFDLDGLMDWYVVIQLYATDDQLQAALVRDRRGVVAGGRWFVVPWDLDLGLRKRRKHGAPAWQKDNFDFFRRRGPGRRYPLQILVHHLFQRDENLRRELAARFRTHLDGELRPAILTERLEHYAAFARRVPVDDLRFIAAHAEFFRHRPAVVRQQVAEYLPQ